MRARTRFFACLGIGWLAACASAPPPRAATPGRTEIVVDEAEVVRVQAPGSRGDRLPALPQALAATSAVFQHGYALAQPLLEAAGPTVPPEDAAGYRAWLDSDFKPWLAARATAVQEAFAALGEVAGGPASEHVVAAALVGSIAARVHAQLVAVPAPPELRGDEVLLRTYQNEVNANAASWLGQAIAALRDCARLASQQPDPAFGPWLDVCQARMAPLEQTNAQALALAQRVAAEREAERIAAEGPRPPGPEVCWTPSTISPTPPPQSAAPAEAKARKCARPAEASPPPPSAQLSPRDQRYGARDASTGVRLSAVLGESPGVDARPLLGDDVRARLALCFAQSVSADAAITLALHATLAVDAQGRVKTTSVAPQPSEPATTLDPRFVRCVQQALAHTAFDCSVTGAAAQVDVTYCARRD